VITVVAVAAEGHAAGALALDEAARWYGEASGGRFVPAFAQLPSVTLARPLAWYTPGGGMGRPPHNSQSLARDALAALDDAARALVGEQLLLVVPPRFHPHTWRLLDGGFHLGGARWCRRYAVVPSGAPLGTVAHELGHLALDWPDLAPESRLGDDCLMASGGSRDGGARPSPPCAPLAVAAGWRALVDVERATRPRDLDGARCGRFAWGTRPLIIERRCDRLLVYPSASPPRLLFRVALADGDDDRPLLALLATGLRSLG
jgi:hypothetical protein